jgi:hypothetical protein
MKTMKHIFIFLGLTLTLSAGAKEPDAAAALTSRSVDCTVKAARLVEFPSLNLQAGLILKVKPSETANVKCAVLSFKNVNMISITYTGIDSMATTHQPVATGIYQVMFLEDGHVRKGLEANTQNVYRPVWGKDHGLLVLKLIGPADESGHPTEGKGWVLDTMPTPDQFADYQVYAVEHGWIQ